MDSPNFCVDLRIQERDLYLDSTDIAKLKLEKPGEIKGKEYPFRHREHMPGLYWMFQAAYMLNELAELDGGAGGVAVWLKRHAPERTYRYRSMRTAEKFVWPEIDRNRGGEERDVFDLEEIVELHGDGARERYKFKFTSDGLALILAVADFWFDLAQDDPDTDVTHLAKKLMALGFSGLEVGDLVYLIARQRINLKIESNLKAWMTCWRDVIDREERERLRKKERRKKSDAC